MDEEKKKITTQHLFKGIGTTNFVGSDPEGIPKDAAHYGSGALVAGVLVVADPTVAATSLIFVDRQTVAGTSGGTFGITRTAGTSFTITSQTAGALTTQAGDTSTVAYLIIP